VRDTCSNAAEPGPRNRFLVIDFWILESKIPVFTSASLFQENVREMTRGANPVDINEFEDMDVLAASAGATNLARRCLWSMMGNGSKAGAKG
jgi:hypothetical protein